MARSKLTEFSAKRALLPLLGQQSTAVMLKADDYKRELKSLAKNSSSIETGTTKYVVKVDQGIKKRGKLGLMGLDLNLTELEQKVAELANQGYAQFIVEPFLKHESKSESYLSLGRVREGIEILYSQSGGVEVESNQGQIKRIILPTGDSTAKPLEDVASVLGITSEFLQKLVKSFNDLYWSFLEINPLVVEDGKQPVILDLAVEADSTAELLVAGGWSRSDFALVKGKRAPEVERVAELDAKSQASLKLELLNPEGAIWMLLSGGGASITVADEIYDQGYGEDIGNYGEYSGNPNAQETEIYANAVLDLMLASSAKHKVLIVAGGVANFTDVRKTFAGLIAALAPRAQELKKAGIKVFVRRGGPNQARGLRDMEEFLEGQDLLGKVSGPDLPLTEIVKIALEELAEADN